MEAREGHATNRPPLFEGTDYSYWKMRMKYYIQSIDYQYWERIESDDYTTTSNKDQWITVDKAEFQKNALTMMILHCSLSRAEFNRISMCSTAKEIWDKLEVTYEGTFRVKETKINSCVCVHAFIFTIYLHISVI